MIDGMVTTSKRDQMAGLTRSREIQGSCQVNRWEIIRGAWETLQMSASHPWARKTSVGCLRCTNHQVFPESKYRMWLMQSPPRPGESFSTPIVVVVENGGPSASGRHLGWPHSREWGHPRWRPEAEGPPFSTTTTMGVEKLSLYYLSSCSMRYISVPSMWSMPLLLTQRKQRKGTKRVKLSHMKNQSTTETTLHS